MKKLMICFTLTALLLSSCGSGTGNKNTEQQSSQASTEVVKTTADWSRVYRPIEPTAITDNIIDLISNQWMLITAGNETSYNTMTASWGTMGEVWGKKVAMITVRNTRYTNEFLEKNERFTLSFYAPDYKQAMQLLGTKSGRDGDKVAEAGLTPVATPAGNMSFGEARMVLECRKIYAAPLSPENMAADIASTYANSEEGHHILYIGEIENVWIK